MKSLYIVRDTPQYGASDSQYCYIVRAETDIEAKEIVRRKTRRQWDWYVELADNKEVWESE